MQVICVIGIGNRLLTDDGFGPAVIDRLMAGPPRDHVVFKDGGTLGLSLLAEIEGTSALIAVDAANIKAPPATIKVFEAEEMDAQLQGRKRTVHEVALGDLLGAAALMGCRPERRALIAAQPLSTAWGESPSPALLKAIPRACVAVNALIDRWTA